VQNNKHYANNKWRHNIFTWKLKSGKITRRRRRKIHYHSPVYRNYIYVLVTINGDTIFLRENSNREKSHGGGGGKFAITHRFTGIIYMSWSLFELGLDERPKKVPSSLEKNVYLY